MKRAKPRKRRLRSPHPGVKIRRARRKHGVTYYAVFKDPDSGKERNTNLNRLGLSNEDARVSWCKKKSKVLQLRRAEIELGVPRKTETPLDEAVEEYLTMAEIEGLSQRTVQSHRGISRQFLEWGNSIGIRYTEELDQPKLELFRRTFLSRLALNSASGNGAKRGAKRKGERARSPHTINNGLGRVRSMLNQWRRMGIVPQLNTDLIRDALRFVRVRKELPRFLHRPDIRRLLEAAERHDAATYKLTRLEHDGEGKAGTTPRYEAVKPFVIVALLTGCRFSELTGLRWEEVDLEAQEIVLRAARTKTARARRIPLDITPALVTLFARLRLQRNGKPYVFGGREPVSRTVLERARHRLVSKFDAPEFRWQDLRRTCGTFLTCAPGIYGGASAFMSAKRLGHSVLVAEQHYVGAVSAVDREAKTLERAMGIDDIVFQRRSSTKTLFAS